MSADERAADDQVTAEVGLAGPGWRLKARLTVSIGPLTRRQMLPLVQSLTDQVVGAAAHSAAERGEPISCVRGCAACCRQLVALAPAEAARLAELVAAMPEPRQTTVRARFAESVRRLEKAGLLERVRRLEELPAEEIPALGRAYFSQRIDCPFLEEESCSIYEDRPLKCREYLVTSPAVHCSAPSADTVCLLPLPFQVSPALARLGEEGTGRRRPRVPLNLLLEWAQQNPEEPEARLGPEWVRLLLEDVTGRRIPLP